MPTSLLFTLLTQVENVAFHRLGIVFVGTV
jgi:hypothetical protein